MKVLIYSVRPSPRLDYTLKSIFEHFLSIPFEYTNDLSYFQQSTQLKINYSQQRISSEELFIPATELLYENHIRTSQPEVRQFEDLKTLFPLDVFNSDFPFDLFAMVFFLLSRYEEYQTFIPDIHNRFTADQSLAKKHNFLHLPIIDLWLEKLKQKLHQMAGQNFCPSKSYQFQPTYDIDLAWAFKHKGFLRYLLSLARILSIGDFFTFRKNLSVTLGQEADPFYTFDYLENLHKALNIKPIYFFLLANYGVYDKNVSHHSPALQNLVQILHSQHRLGIHPSYASNQRADLLNTEILRLQNIIQQPVVLSRQHFLKLRFPETFQSLLKYNIKEDFSLGYASDIGFRASTSRSFLWYDLEKEQTTQLLLHPFQIMDVTLKSYLQLSPEQALQKVENIIRIIRQTKGTFTSLWHNSSFSYVDGWQDWKSVYEKILNLSIP